MGRKACGWAALAMLCCLAPAFAVKLEYSTQVGQSSTYKMTFQATQQATIVDTQQHTTAKGELTWEQRVQQVKRNGEILTQFRFRDGSLNINTPGMPATTMALTFPTVQTRSLKTGETLGVQIIERGAKPTVQPQNRMLEGFDFNDFFTDMSALGFPKKDVKVGESWNSRSSFTAPGGQRIQITSRSILVALKTVQGKAIAEIQTEARFPLRMNISMLGIPAETSGTTSVSMTSYFAYQEGRLASMVGTATSEHTLTMDMSSFGGINGQNIVRAPVSQTMTFNVALQVNSP